MQRPESVDRVSLGVVRLSGFPTPAPRGGTGRHPAGGESTVVMFPSFNARAVGLTLPAGRTIEIAARAGFVGVDLLVRDLLDAGDDPASLLARMEGLGLRAGAFPLPVDWRSDAASFSRDLAALPRLADVAAVLGLGRTGTWVTPDLFPAPDGPEYRATLDLHVERLGAIADVLAPRGIRLGLEVIGVERSRTRGTPRFITRLSDLGPILSALAPRRNVGLLLDAFHLHASGESIEEALRAGVPSIVWVHVADLPPGAPIGRDRIEDSRRGLPGEHGAVENRAVLTALRDGGYDGPVTGEPLGRCRTLSGRTPEEVAALVATSLRSVWPEPWPPGS